MSRSQWAWTKSGIGHLARALSSLIAIGRVATVVMVVLAMFPAVGLGKIGNLHHSRSAGSTINTSRTGHAAPSIGYAWLCMPPLLVRDGSGGECAG